MFFNHFICVYFIYHWGGKKAYQLKARHCWTFLKASRKICVKVSFWYHKECENLFSLFSYQVMSNSSLSHGLQHARLPCPSPAPGTCSNSCPSSQWYLQPSHSLSSFSSCLQSFPSSGSFLTSQLFASGGQSVGASDSASVLPMNIQGWFPLGLISKEIKTVLAEENV